MHSAPIFMCVVNFGGSIVNYWLVSNGTNTYWAQFVPKFWLLIMKVELL